VGSEPRIDRLRGCGQVRGAAGAAPGQAPARA